MKKIISFIKNNENKLLILLGSDKDPEFHESFWYTVTGAKEEQDDTLVDTVKREVKEETNLDVINIKYLNWILKYTSLGCECEEYVYISEVSDIQSIDLNEEHIDYRWCDFNEYINTIKWYGDKGLLRRVLQAALAELLYLDEETITSM